MATSTSPSLGRSSAGSAKTGPPTARSRPRTDVIVRKSRARGAIDITAIAPATPVFLDLAHRRLERIAILPITVNHSVRPRESGDATPPPRSAMNSRRLMSDIKLAPAFACSVQSSFRQISNCARHIRVVDQLEAAFTAGLTGRGVRSIFGICGERLDCFCRWKLQKRYKGGIQRFAFQGFHVPAT